MEMTRAQFSTYVASLGATYHAVKDGVEWWRLRDGRWVGAKEVRRGIVAVRQFEAGACSC